MKLLLPFLLLSLVFYSNAQEPVRLIIDEKVGLPSNEVYAIEEDSQGFVWLATNKGLIRYDGAIFKSYDHPQQRGLSIFEPFVDEQDRVWCMNISGQVFYAKDDQFELVADLKDELKGSLASIVANENYLIVSMFLKNIIIDLKTGKQHIEKLRRKDDENSVSYGLNKSYDKQFFQTLNAHIRIFKEGSFVKDRPLPKSLIPSKRRPRPIQLLKNNNGHFCILQQIPYLQTKFFVMKGQQWLDLKVPDSFHKVNIIMAQFIDDKLWCSTNKGLFVFSISEDSLILEATYLKGTFTTDFFQDNDRNIWVSTLRKGLVIMPNIYVKQLDLNGRLPKRLEKIENDELLIGFESGEVSLLNTQHQQQFLDMPTSSPVSSIMHDPENRRTFIFQKALNYLYTRENNRLTEIKEPLATVKDAALIHQDTMIAALATTLITTSINKDQFATKENYQLLKNKRGYAVLYDSVNKTKYFAAVDGLYYQKNGVDMQLLYYKGSPLFIRKLLLDQNGFVWACSFKNGIYKIDQQEVVKHLHTQNGLTSAVVNAIALDKNHLWIATENSLLRYDTVTGEIRSLGTNDGLPSYAIIDMAITEKYIYMNTAQEVFQLKKDKVFKPNIIPEYYFTEVLINGKEQQQQSVYTVPDQETSTVISFNANGLRGLTSSSFQYRIKDHTDWTVLPVGSNSVQFASLPVGSITFELQQKESNVTKHLYFKVQQVFYKTLWFWALMAGIIIGGIIFYYRRLLRFRESEKNKELRNLALDNELVSLRLENLRSQMNPHFIFNALNSIQEYIINNEKNLASSYLVKFSRLIRMYLEQSREHHIMLEVEIKALQLYLELEKVRFEEKLNYQLEVDPVLDIQKVMVPPLFIQPYVENALKHGLLHKKTNRRLHISFSWDKEHNRLIVSVEDNGVGRAKAAAIQAERSDYHRSFATYANTQRVELLNRKRENNIEVEIVDLTSSEGQPLGTRICISIPQA
ncbi:sensor histidine kinase [Nonlabens xiamenensis]|uniref:sensor histidine kinase n=1 Tax=Nonlabens xiamenensis TaxID=2341043 RepID=UPI000F60B8FF|nr:histidine kinase [Nonlabens xiamenensis]